MRWLVLIIALLLGACGYHFAGTSGSLPEGVTQIQVVQFENTTSEPYLEQRLTDAVIDQLRRHREIRLVATENQAEAILTGVVVAFSNNAISFLQNDQIGTYRVTLVADTMLRRQNSDELLWSGRSSWSTEFNAAIDVAQQSDLKVRALEELTQRLAEEIFYQLLDDF